MGAHGRLWELVGGQRRLWGLPWSHWELLGAMLGAPIINPPQSAILGMHGIKQRAVVVNNEIVARPVMYLALTYDHRLVDGREAVTFLKSICDYIENPTRLLLGV